MNQFELVNQLISYSSNDSKKSLRNMLKLSDESGDDSKSKSELLLNLIIKYKGNATEKELCNKIYSATNEKSLKALGKLVLRLKDKIYDNLLLEKNLLRNNAFSELRKVKSELQRLLLLCNVLEVNTAQYEIERICDKVIQKGKDYELYNELLSGYEIKYNLLSLKNDKNLLGEINKEIEFYDRCRISLFSAKKKYDELLIDLNLKTGVYKSDKLQQLVVELEHEYRYTQSTNVLYYLHLFSIHYFHSTEDFAKSEEHCLELLSLVKEKKAVYLHERLGQAYLLLAKNNLYSYSFKSAIENANSGLSYSKTKLGYLFRLNEIIFQAHFYSGEISKAKKLLEDLSNNAENLTNIETAKCSFYKACISFLYEDNKTVNQHLNDITDIEKDKDGWNIGIRMLSILNLLKSEKFEIVESKIESLRKHIERSEKTDEVSPRNRLIFQLLVELGRSSYNYKQVYDQQKESFDLLSSFINQYKWTLRSPELIRFHDWFKAKAYNTAYELKVSTIEGIKIPEKVN